MFFMVHVSDTKWPPVGRWTPLGSPVRRDVELLEQFGALRCRVKSPFPPIESTRVPSEDFIYFEPPQRCLVTRNTEEAFNFSTL